MWPFIKKNKKRMSYLMDLDGPEFETDVLFREFTIVLVKALKKCGINLLAEPEVSIKEGTWFWFEHDIVVEVVPHISYDFPGIRVELFRYPTSDISEDIIVSFVRLFLDSVLQKFFKGDGYYRYERNFKVRIRKENATWSPYEKWSDCEYWETIEKEKFNYMSI